MMLSVFIHLLLIQTSQNPTEDLSSSSSSSSSSSLSLSTSSSSSWDKFRLQCIIEHVLQYDVRLQEILKRQVYNYVFRFKYSIQPVTALIEATTMTSVLVQFQTV